jgi:hypothetical protein
MKLTETTPFNTYHSNIYIPARTIRFFKPMYNEKINYDYTKVFLESGIQLCVREHVSVIMNLIVEEERKIAKGN